MILRFFFDAIIGYLLGSISPAFLIGKLVKGVDIREHGSGNLGSTNALRVLGVVPALLTFIVDASKGFFAIWISDLIFSGEFSGYEDIAKIVSGLAVILGHSYPFYLKFKGGKGIATAFGIACYLNPFGAVCLLLIEWIVVLSSGYVSLASMICSAMFPVAVNLFHLKKHAPNIFIWAMCLLIGGIAVIRHIPNIKRLIRGEENKFKLKDRKEEESVLQQNDSKKNGEK